MVLPPIPEDGQELRSCHPNQETLTLLALRRSTLARCMTEPGPNADQIAELIRLATRVPDHGKLAPWRFILFEGETRREFGQKLAKRFADAEPAADEERLEFERNRLTQAPLVIALVSTAAPHVKVPEWEQVLSCGAVGQNLLIAANAMGFAAQWITEWFAFDAEIAKELGLADHEKIAGFFYFGTATQEPVERKRPMPENLVTNWKSD